MDAVLALGYDLEANDDGGTSLAVLVLAAVVLPVVIGVVLRLQDRRTGGEPAVTGTGAHARSTTSRWTARLLRALGLVSYALVLVAAGVGAPILAVVLLASLAAVLAHLGR